MPVQDTEVKIDKFKLMTFTENVLQIIEAVRLTFIRLTFTTTQSKVLCLYMLYWFRPE